MENKNVEVSESGLKCDNPQCDWRDESITFDKCADWINRPCPKCGNNLLTLEDYKNAEVIMMAATLLNGLTLDELSELSKGCDLASIKEHPMFKGAEGLDLLEDEQMVNIRWDTHKEIKVERITPA